MYQLIIQERDSLKEHVRKLERELDSRFDINGSNIVEKVIEQRNQYIKRAEILEKAVLEGEAARSREIDRLKQEGEESERRRDELYRQVHGLNGYRERLESTQVALQLANCGKSNDVVALREELLVVTKEREEFSRQARSLELSNDTLHRDWTDALGLLDSLEKQKIVWEHLQGDTNALRKAQDEMQELMRENIALETSNAELSLRIRTLEDILGASPDVEMSGVSSDIGTPARNEVFGDAVWRKWSNRLRNHIQTRPLEVDEVYRLAAANLYRPGGSFPAAGLDLHADSPRQQFPGVTWVKNLMELGSHPPASSPAGESTWRAWADEIQDWIGTVPGEIEVLYRLGQQGNLMAGVEWIRQLIAVASDRPNSAERPLTLKEYQMSVALKEYKRKTERLQSLSSDRQQADIGSEIYHTSSEIAEQKLESANRQVETLQQEMEGLTVRFEDEIEQLARKLADSEHLYELLKGVSGLSVEKRDAIEELQKKLTVAYAQVDRFRELHQKEKALSDEHEEVWRRKFDKEVEGADKHAAGLVEEAETLQGRLNGAHGVITELEREINKLKKQIGNRHAGDSGSCESIRGSGAASEVEERRQSTPEIHRSESELQSDYEEQESEELKTMRTDLYNTLEEVEELKLKLGFANRAFNDTKEEFERKIAQMENNTKEDVVEKERVEEKLRSEREKFARGVAAEVRRLEREGKLLKPPENPPDQLRENDPEGTGEGRGKERKVPAPLKPKKPEGHEETLLPSPLKSPLESPDILMKGDAEYKGSKSERNAKSRKVQGIPVSEVGSEALIGTRRSTRMTRNAKPVYTDVPLITLMERRKIAGGRKRKRKVGEVEGVVEGVKGKEGKKKVEVDGSFDKAVVAGEVRGGVDEPGKAELGK